jgi:cytidylate kinase
MAGRLEIVTIDGPSGVGKSTVSRKLADRLGFTYLDTGAMYRAVALKCREADVDVRDERAVTSILPGLDLQLLPAVSEGEDVRVILDGEDVSTLVRTEEIGMLASAVSALPDVRRALTEMQQQYGVHGRIVAEGRDTGTIVFPAAAWKFFLDAAPEERAGRRARQLRHRGESVDEEEILRQITRRDRDDSERTIAPLKAAPDAVHIDSTRLGPEEVVQRMLSFVRGE